MLRRRYGLSQIQPPFGMTWLQVAVAALLIGGITYAYWPRRAR